MNSSEFQTKTAFDFGGMAAGVQNMFGQAVQDYRTGRDAYKIQQAKQQAQQAIQNLMTVDKDPKSQKIYQSLLAQLKAEPIPPEQAAKEMAAKSGPAQAQQPQQAGAGPAQAQQPQKAGAGPAQAQQPQQAGAGLPPGIAQDPVFAIDQLRKQYPAGTAQLNKLVGDAIKQFLSQQPKAAGYRNDNMIKTASGYNDPRLPGRFFEKEADLKNALVRFAKKKGKGGPKGMAKSIKGEEHPHAACMDKVRRHEIDVEDPEAFCAEAVDIAKGTTHWRGKEKD